MVRKGRYRSEVFFRMRFQKGEKTGWNKPERRQKFRHMVAGCQFQQKDHDIEADYGVIHDGPTAGRNIIA